MNYFFIYILLNIPSTNFNYRYLFFIPKFPKASIDFRSVIIGSNVIHIINNKANKHILNIPNEIYTHTSTINKRHCIKKAMK